MNCDQVFDILTRGPFPTGTACDTPVEAHLNMCRDCRRLAEALRPALELFQEAIGPEESRDLPGYWCAVATEQTQPAVSYAQELKPRRMAGGMWSRNSLVRHWSGVTVWRMAAMLALGITVGSLVGSRVMLEGRGTIPPVGSSLAPLANDDDHKDDLKDAAIAAPAEWAVLPAACSRNQPGTGPRYSVRGDRLLANADLSNLDCCSECHNANSDTVPKSATMKVAQHCQVCHNDQARR
jgi:hypothetical protein